MPGIRHYLTLTMRYRALACDYDGTLADAGNISPDVRAALARARAAGIRIILVTGRRLDDLERVCADARAIFDAIVAENGGLYLRTPAGAARPLGPPPPPGLLARLRDRGVEPLVAGEVVVSTLVTEEAEVAAAIRALGLDWRMILNKTALMLLPAGVDKGSGVAVAFADLGISPADAVGIGDGENDLPLLARCGLGVAVASAVPPLKAAADLVTRGGAGAGVAEVADALHTGDEVALAPVGASVARR
jgi:hydroxymethylpyrimidine pyrophosphatase-like HAD family hydrolase